jgi:hypothetical protein
LVTIFLEDTFAMNPAGFALFLFVATINTFPVEAGGADSSAGRLA